MTPLSPLLKSIADHEGFSSTAYPDPISKGKPYTFGHGLTTITESESLQIVQNRITSIRAQLSVKLPYYSGLPDACRDILDEMAYQMGVVGLLNFVFTLKLVEKGDYLGASNELKLSRWASQTPKRASTLISRMAQIPNKG